MTVFSRLKKRFYFFAASYFRFFANFSLKRWHPRIFTITGSAGKTTLLSLLEFELGDQAHYSHNANSAFGIPFDILGLRGITGSKFRWILLFFAAPVRALTFTHHEAFYVAEIDCERPHEAEFLAEWLQPEVTFWVSLGLSHAAQFDQSAKDQPLDAVITHEFAALPRHTQKLVYVSGDIPTTNDPLAGVSAEIKKIRKSDMRSYVVYPDHSDFTHGQTVFHFACPQPQELSIQLLMLKHFIEKYLQLPLKTDFSTLQLPPGRSSYFPGIKDTNLIDSSYNAHIVSMAPILNMARLMKTTGPKWLIIGDIVDQGSIEEEEHKKLAGLIADVEADQIILIGRRTKKYTAPALKKFGVSAVTTTDPRRALKFIENHLQGGETLIFKGSQYLEWIIEKLLVNPADADKLCRRDPAANKRRASWGLD